MSTVIKLKYAGVGGSVAPADDVLAQAEPAYSFNSDKLFIGYDNGVSIEPHVIGGKYFTDKLDHAPGVLTPSSAILVDSNSKIDVLNVDNITIDDKSMRVTELNGDLTLRANGTGSIIFGSAAQLGDLDAGNLSIVNNTISATDANGGINLTPNGTGLVQVISDQGLLIASGTEGTRPSAASVSNGVIRYNETTNRFEGTVSGNWTGLGGVVDIDQDTYITAEESSDDDTLRLYTAGIQRLAVNSSGVTSSVNISAPSLGVDNVTIDGDSIDINGSTISATGNVGSGSIILDPAPAAGDNGGDLIVRGNLQVTGTTTTINSTVIEIDDPVIVLGGSTATDTLDRGMQFKYTPDGGTTQKTAFAGWDRGTDDNFTFINDGSVGSAKFADLKLQGSITSVDGVAPGAGQLLIGNATNGDMELATLTEGDSVSITNSNGGIKIDVNMADAVTTTDIIDTGDGVVNYSPTSSNAGSRGAATFASEQFNVSSGHVVITTIEGGSF